MADLNLDWGGDLALTPAGDLALSDGATLTRQRIVRRLLTSVGGYVWHPSYGAGLPQRIGRPARADVIKALVRAQIFSERSVATSPMPKIDVTEPDSNPGLFIITIAYTDAITGVPIQISLEVPGK